MTALLAALVLAALPARDEVRYRVELDGQHLGWARLTVACGGSGCEVTWQSALRQPAEAGGGLVTRRLEAATDAGGRARRVRVEVVADGRRWETHGRSGAVPALVGELLLAGAAEGERRCLAVADEESGRAGKACGRRAGPWVEAVSLGEPVRLRAGPGELPAEVLVPGQRLRFVADPSAALPPAAPRLFGVEVPAAREGQRWCRRAPDREAAEAAAGAAPRSFPAGATCRERTARYLALAAERGLRGRHAVGVAFDGTTMVWHEWAELWTGRRWVPVDPSFEQAPAAGRRFTVARFEEGDLAARAAAGRAVLACWRR